MSRPRCGQIRFQVNVSGIAQFEIEQHILYSKLERTTQLPSLGNQCLGPVCRVNCEQPAAWLPLRILLSSQNLDFPSLEVVGPQKVDVCSIVRNAAVREGSPAGGCSICKTMERKQHCTFIVCQPGADELALILQRAVSQVTGGHEQQRTDCDKRALHLWSSNESSPPGLMAQVRAAVSVPTAGPAALGYLAGSRSFLCVPAPGVNSGPARFEVAADAIPHPSRKRAGITHQQAIARRSNRPCP